MQKIDKLTQVHSTEAPQRSEKHQQEVQQLQQHHSLGGRQAGRVRHQAGDHRVGHGHRVSGEKADSSLPGVKLISINQKSTICVSQRIVEIKSLVTETENAVLTSSIDRSIKVNNLKHIFGKMENNHLLFKVWNLDYIFEKEHHIDKHELTIDSLSISTSAQLAVVVTRSCIGKVVAKNVLN